MSQRKVCTNCGAHREKKYMHERRVFVDIKGIYSMQKRWFCLYSTAKHDTNDPECHLRYRLKTAVFIESKLKELEDFLQRI